MNISRLQKKCVYRAKYKITVCIVSFGRFLIVCLAGFYVNLSLSIFQVSGIYSTVLCSVARRI